MRRAMTGATQQAAPEDEHNERRLGELRCTHFVGGSESLVRLLRRIRLLAIPVRLAGFEVLQRGGGPRIGGGGQPTDIASPPAATQVAVT